ncbi:MAG: hypothetical protein ACOCXA_07395, partial [Planctomycetota bacterium]
MNLQQSAMALLLAVLPCAGSLLMAAEPTVTADDVVELDLANFDIIPPQERWQFSPPPERRDVFFDLEQRLAAELKIRQLQAAQDQAELEALAADIEIDEGNISDIEDALERAEAILADVQQDMAAQRWDQALRRSTNGIKVLSAIVRGQAPDERITKIIDKLARFQVLAEEAKLLEEAKQEFAKLA